MALDVYVKEDILRVLRSEYHTNKQALELAEENTATEMYRKGHNAALEAVALAFGLVPIEKPKVISWETS